MTQQEEKPKGPSPEERVAKSRSDREVASLRKEIKAIQDKAATAERERDEAHSTVALLKEQMGLGDNESERLKVYTEREAKQTKIGHDLEARARQLKAQELSIQYGIPESDLLEYDDPHEMEVAALKRALAMKKEAESKEEKDEKGGGFDTGAGSLFSKSIGDMSKAEFDKHWDKSKAQSLQRARTR